MTENLPCSPAPFLITKEYRRFAEFCEACRKYRYIGLCYGPPGVGKTLSARHYTNWDKLLAYEPFFSPSPVSLDEVTGCNTVFYTPKVAISPGQIERDIHELRAKLKTVQWSQLEKEKGKTEPGRQRETVSTAAAQGGSEEEPTVTERIVWHYRSEYREAEDPTTLIIVDEADRLKMAGLEQMRDIFDRSGIGLVLIGMPGLEKRLSRYAQLYSRVGFVHSFRPLREAETRHLLTQKWEQMGLTLTEGDFTDEEALTAVIRITGGNFRLLHRLLAQIERILQINELSTITKEVVDTARESLVIGSV